MREKSLTSYTPLKNALIKSILIFLIFTMLRTFIYELSYLWFGLICAFFFYTASKFIVTEVPRTNKYLKAMTIMNGPSSRIVKYINNDSIRKKYDTLNKKIVHEASKNDESSDLYSISEEF